MRFIGQITRSFLSPKLMAVVVFVLGSHAMATSSSSSRGTPNTPTKGLDRKTSHPSIQEWALMIANWKEESYLSRSDGVDYKIKTQNSVVRINYLRTLRNKNFYTRVGLLAGQSANSGLIEATPYFQRSVFVGGIEAFIGKRFFIGKEAEFSFSLGGIYRQIQHTPPTGPYKFSTASRLRPLVFVDLRWELSPSFSWVQSLGTSGTTDDTFWSSGIGFNL